MKKAAVSFSRPVAESEVEGILAEWARDERARIVIRRPLRSGPSGTHWHIGGTTAGMGTVEVNLVPTTRSIDVIVHDNRTGTWAGHAYRGLARLLRSRLCGDPR